MTVNQIERLVLKAKRQVLREENAKYTCAMRPVPRDQWPDAVVNLQLARPVAVWRSRYHLAVLYQEPGKAAQRLSVCRAAIGDDGRFADGLSWDELQEVKNECGFEDRDAIEIYPRNADVVNVSNMRHLWILPSLCVLTWRSESATAVGAVDPHDGETPA